MLLGDAAHSMFPTLGQGVNAALEDARVLDDVLESCQVGTRRRQAIERSEHGMV